MKILRYLICLIILPDILRVPDEERDLVLQKWMTETDIAHSARRSWQSYAAILTMILGIAFVEFIYQWTPARIYLPPSDNLYFFSHILALSTPFIVATMLGRNVTKSSLSEYVSLYIKN